MQRAGQRDVVDVVARGLGQGTVLAPTSNAAEDEARVAGEALVRTEAEPLHDAGTKPLDQRVGLLDEAEQGCDAVGVLEVDRHRAPAAVEHVASGIPSGGSRAIDTHDVGAHVGQHHGGERARSDARHLDHADPFERSHDRRRYQASNAALA